MAIDERHALALDRMLELTVLLNGDMTRRLGQDGLTTSRVAVLWHLRHHGPVTQRALADALHVSARTITGLVDGLEATGFVTREPHPTDRRAILVTTTKHGRRVTEALGTEQEEMAEVFFGGVPAKQFDCFLAGLGDALERLRAALGTEGQR